MRALIQRVHLAEVEVDGVVVGRIGFGLLVYVGVGHDDTVPDAERLAEKVAGSRIFEDRDGKMNLSCQDVRGGVLAVPNFTLMADTREGRRPSFTGAAPPEEAERLYEAFVEALEDRQCAIGRGVFGARMVVRSAAAGPVNILIEVPSPPR